MKIAIDAMGGDNAPQQIVDGLLECFPELDKDVNIILVGIIDEIKKCFNGREKEWESRIEYEEAPDVIGMKESPLLGMKKKPDSSVAIAARLVKDGKADGIMSAGNTGAMVSATHILLGLIPGVQRAGIAAVIPSPTNPMVMMDVGANVNCRAPHLIQYAAMAGVFCSKLFDKPKPKLALLSVGEESGKGNLVVQETIKILDAYKDAVDLPFNYVGQAEGHDFMSGNYDIIICDGFVGNIVLKFAESLGELIVSILKDGMRNLQSSSADTGKLSKLFMELLPDVDWAESGGAELLGLNGTSTIAHGRSNSRAIANAIKNCARMIKMEMKKNIEEVIQLVNSQLLKNSK